MDNAVYVKVTDFDMPIMTMVLLIIKWLIATFIAGLIVAIPTFLFWVLLLRDIFKK